MPESQQPPSWGPAYDERDLDALLSGDLANLPEALIPLAGSLAALHARPARAELAGEAAARAAFRYFARDPGSWAGEPEPGTVLARTLVLPRPPADRPRRHTPRHRRRPAGGTVRRPMAIGGIAAAAVLVAGVAVAALVPASLHHKSHTSAGPTTSAPGTVRPSPSPKVLGTGTKQSAPEIRPAPASSSNSAASTDGTLCRTFYGFFAHPETKSAWADEVTLWWKLRALAGSQRTVLTFCLPYLDSGTWASKGTQAAPPHGNDSWPWGDQGNTGNDSAGQNSTGTGGQPGSAGGQPGDTKGQASNGTGNAPASSPASPATATASSDSGSGSGSGQPVHSHLSGSGNQGTTTGLAG